MNTFARIIQNRVISGKKKESEEKFHFYKNHDIELFLTQT